MANHKLQTTNHGAITCPVVTLCGGLGLRLRPAIQDKPKCLAPIGGRPFLEWLLGGLQRQGCAKVILCLGYGSKEIVEFLQRREITSERHATHDSGFRIPDSGRETQMEIRYVVEQQPLGTGGALRNAAPLIHEDHFLAMNGDTIFDVDLQQLLRAHIERNALATVALRPNPESAMRYSGVELDAEGCIVRFSEKGQVENQDERQKAKGKNLEGPPHPHGGEGIIKDQATESPSAGHRPGNTVNAVPAADRGSANAGKGAGKHTGVAAGTPAEADPRVGPTADSLINGGVYAFAKEIFEMIPGPPTPSSLEKDVFPSIVGQHFYGFPCDGYFLDIGIPEDYHRAQVELPERFKPW